MAHFFCLELPAWLDQCSVQAVELLLNEKAPVHNDFACDAFEAMIADHAIDAVKKDILLCFVPIEHNCVRVIAETISSATPKVLNSANQQALKSSFVLQNLMENSATAKTRGFVILCAGPNPKKSCRFDDIHKIFENPNPTTMQLATMIFQGNFLKPASQKQQQKKKQKILTCTIKSDSGSKIKCKLENEMKIIAAFEEIQQKCVAFILEIQRNCLPYGIDDIRKFFENPTAAAMRFHENFMESRNLARCLINNILNSDAMLSNSLMPS